jgi:uncharacterized SAM-binding protein YcdF (DUF218 family)
MILWPVRLALKIIGIVLALILAYFVITAFQVWLTSRQYDPHHASAMVVMGAAQYNGNPSPDLEARLNEALLLYRQGYARTIVVTGYKEPGDHYTEAETGARYLESKGVPASDIIQVAGSDSWENLADAAPRLKAAGDTTVLIVTDPFHEDRSMAIASSLGLTPYPTPTRTSPITGWATLPYFAKEAVGVGLGRIIGFNNLDGLHADF